MAAFPRGRFCWHELMTTDVEAAKRFYSKIVGWKTEPWPADPSYTLIMKGKTPLGGMMVLPEQAKRAGAPPNWMPYIAVSDTNDLIRQVTDFGGKLLSGPSTVPVVGTWAQLQDPQGAAFAVLQPATEAPGTDGPYSAGDFSWHELATADPQAAWNFYEMLFGWEKMESMDMGPAGSYDMFGRKGKMLGGMYRKPAEMPGPPNWMSYAMVSSADSAAQLVKQLGGSIMNGPMDVPGGDRIAQCTDPQGVFFAVHSAATKPAAKPKAAKKKAKKKTAKKAAKKKTAKKTTKKATKKKTAKKSKAKAAKKGKRKVAKKKAAKKKATKRNATKKRATRKAKRKGAKKKASKKRPTRKKR
jgi:predicted enzyme related to lactoylglutathione lyase